MNFLHTAFETVRQSVYSGGMVLVYGVVAAVTGVIAWFWSKHPVRWVLMLVTVGVVLLVVWQWGKLSSAELHPDLPRAFFPPRFWLWILALSLATLYLTVHMVSVWVRMARGSQPASTDEPGRFPDLEAAWDEILMRLSHAQYDAGRQNVFLLVAQDEALAASMVHAAGVQLFAQAPVDENAPIHAYATADGLFLSCAGACAWGRGADDGPARLVELCRKLHALNPELPVLRGIAVLYPMERAASAELLQGIAALRNDLQTIRAETHVRCPTVAVFCQQEPDPYFDEFAVRIAPGVRARRCGFSVPLGQAFDQAAAGTGLRWLVQWFSTWSLNLMSDEYARKDGNSRLVLMNARLWRELPALGNLVNASFSTHSRSEPILVRGCYFVQCGPALANQAFVSGLVGGRASKMVADASLASWSEGAHALDRRYRLAALGLGVACAVLVLPVWYWAILANLETVRANHPSWPWLAWACLGTLALIWAAALLAPWRRRRRPVKRAQGA